MFELAKKACGVGGPPTRSGVNSGLDMLLENQRRYYTINSIASIYITNLRY